MQRLFGLFTLFIVTVGLTWCQADSPQPNKVEAEKLFQEGKAFQKARKYSLAIEKYKAALASSQDFSYHFQLGLCYRSSKQYEHAIAAMASAIKLKPNFGGGHNALGELYILRRDYDQGIESFNQALKYEPNLKTALDGVSAAYARKGQQLLDEGKLSAAGALMEEALQRRSDNPAVYLVAARVYNKLERPEKSIEVANEAMKLRKENSKGAEYFEIGIAHKKLNEFDRARRAFAEARKDPKYSRHAQNELNALKGK